MADHHSETRARWKRWEWLPFDVFGKHCLERRLIRLMVAGHGIVSFPRDHWTSFTSSVIAALSTFETGQFFSASPAIRAKPESSRLGTLPRKVRADLLILNPWPSGSSVTAASVESSVGSSPAACRPNANAMVKQPACAAAISSSGFVPFSLSKRVLNE